MVTPTVVAGSAQRIHPSQRVNIRDLREEKFKHSGENNKMLPAQCAILVSCDSASKPTENVQILSLKPFKKRI